MVSNPLKSLTPFIVSTFALLLSPHIAHAQFPEIHSYHTDPGAHERNRNIDVTHMKVEVKFDVYKKSVMGKVTHTFIALQNQVDTIFFDAPGIQIISATLDGRALSHTTLPEGVVVQCGLHEAIAMPIARSKKPKTQHQIVFEYIAYPKKGIYFSGYTAANGQPLTGNIDDADMIRKQIWTQGQGIDNRHWIPMIDDRSDKYITETVVTHDSKHQVLSNGTLKSKKVNKDGTTTWHYALNQPHAGYLLMLGIGNYAVKNSKTALGTQIQFWYYPEHPEKVEPTSRYSEQIIDFLATETGIPYPWISYSQVMVQDFLYGAMENTSATTFGDFFWVDKRGFQDRNYVVVNAHEATHQWFGDFITGRHDGEQWLQESFATFYPGLFVGSVYGNDELDWYFRDQMNGAVAAGKANSLPVRHSAAGSSRHYPKGASVLHMLRHILGEDNFRRSINHYLQKHAFATVETWDLQKAIMDETGINMDWFFDQWIHRGGEPIYSFAWNAHQNASIENKAVVETSPSYSIQINIDQKQKQDAVVGLFKMPIDIEVLYYDGTSEKRTVWVDQAHHTFTWQSFKAPATVVFDAGSHVLKTVETQKSRAEWLWQLSHGNHMLDRYDALVSLRNDLAANPGNVDAEKVSSKAAALREAWQKETFREMKTEIAAQWMDLPGMMNVASVNAEWQSPGNGSIKASSTETFMLHQISHSEFASVRRVFYDKLPTQAKYREVLLNGLKDSSYNNVEFVINKLWQSPEFYADRSTILESIKSENGHLHNIKIKYLECAYEHALQKSANGEPKSAENDPQMYVNLLKDMAGPYHEFRTRTQAMSALKRLNYLDVELAHNLFDGVLNFNSRLSQPATELINHFKQNSAYKQILLSALSSNTLTEPNSTSNWTKTYTKSDQARLLRVIK
jgi:aminopeptidase N